MLQIPAVGEGGTNSTGRPSWASQGAQILKNLPFKAGDTGDAGLIQGWGDPLEKDVETHSSVLAWIIPWTEEPGRLQFMGLQRVRYD